MGKEEDLKLVNEYQKEFALLSQINQMLEWDLETYLPRKGNEDRAEQSSLIEKLNHEKFASDELFNALERLRKESLSEDESKMFERLYNDVLKARKLPSEFVEEFSRAASLAFDAWQEAKQKSDFSIFKPHLEKLVELNKKKADYIGLEGHPYNSLMDDFEEGMTVEKLKPKFEELKKGILDILNRIKCSQEYKNQKRSLFLGKGFSKEKQLKLAEDVRKRIGLSEGFSRLDIAEHPFCVQPGYEDIRVTTNIKDSPLFCFLSTIHESGHGLYEFNLPKEFRYTSLGEAPSFGIHESQSRFWEIMLAKRRPFWEFYFDKFKEAFGVEDFEQLIKEINMVEPSLIRIESDELHYILHIILRFEIELDLVEGNIEVKDLPEIWNRKMEQMFGIVPESDSEGVLQDVHWSHGAFGYFPTYALGSVYAAQIYNKIKEEVPEFEEDIKNGNYSMVREWLKENVHQKGRKYLADEIISQVCGSGLNPQEFLKYLEDKYSEFYSI
ncbi:MAG: carboxypeptidase M32 [Candidatus Pacearchaeota archaeon]